MKKISKIFSIAMILMISLTTFSSFDLKASDKFYTKEEMELRLNRMRSLDTTQEQELLDTLDDDVVIIGTSAWDRDKNVLQLEDLSAEQTKLVDEANLYLLDNEIMLEEGDEIEYNKMTIYMDKTGSVILTTDDFKAYLSEVAYFDIMGVDEINTGDARATLVPWKTRLWSTKDKVYVTMKNIVSTGAAILAYKIPFVGNISAAAGLYNIWKPGTYTKTTYFKDVYKVYSTCTNNGAGIRYRTSYTGSARTPSQKITTSQYRFSSDSYRC